MWEQYVLEQWVRAVCVRTIWAVWVRATCMWAACVSTIVEWDRINELDEYKSSDGLKNLESHVSFKIYIFAPSSLLCSIIRFASRTWVNSLDVSVNIDKFCWDTYESITNIREYRYWKCFVLLVLVWIRLMWMTTDSVRIAWETAWESCKRVMCLASLQFTSDDV